MPEKDRVKMVVNKLELRKSKSGSEFNEVFRELQLSKSARDIVNFCNTKGVQKFELKTDKGTLICVFRSGEGTLKERAQKREGKGTDASSAN